MKNIKKISALILALILVLSLGATALATVDSENGSYEGSNDRGHAVNGLNVPITKSIIIFNPESGTTVRVPNIEYVYSVAPAPATALGTITDDGRYNLADPSDPNSKQPVTVMAKAGETDGVIGTTIPFGTTRTSGDEQTVSAKPTGAEVENDSNLTVDLSKFTHAGVYRYVITETVQNASGNDITSTISNYGLEARTTAYETTRYLDIYLSNGGTVDSTTNPAGLQLTGAVIFKTNTTDDSSNGVTSGITTTTDKTTGYEPGTTTPVSGDPDYTNDVDVDRYFTYNLKVGKTTTGALADKSNNFPFEITLTAANTLAPTVIADYSKHNASWNDGSSKTVANASTGYASEPTTIEIKNGDVKYLTPGMSDGDYIEVKGLPKGTTATVKETNNTPDIYTAAWDTTAGTTSVATVVSDNTDTSDLALANGKSATAATIDIDGNQTVSSGTISGDYLKTVLGYTNTLAEISPTGVALRIAPFALMLAAGIVLFILVRRRREEAEEA